MPLEVSQSGVLLNEPRDFFPTTLGVVEQYGKYYSKTVLHTVFFVCFCGGHSTTSGTP